MTDHGGWVTTEEWLLLATLFAARRPRGMYDVITSIQPPPRAAGRTATWSGRHRRLCTVFLRLYRRGLVREAALTGERTEDGYELTPSGRWAVVNAGRLWSGLPAGG